MEPRIEHERNTDFSPCSIGVPSMAATLLRAQLRGASLPLLAICATRTTYEGARRIIETVCAKPLSTRVYGASHDAQRAPQNAKALRIFAPTSRQENREQKNAMREQGLPVGSRPARIEHERSSDIARVPSVFCPWLPRLAPWCINHPVAGIPGQSWVRSWFVQGPSKVRSRSVSSRSVQGPKTAKNKGTTRCSTREEKNRLKNMAICTSRIRVANPAGNGLRAVPFPAERHGGRSRQLDFAVLRLSPAGLLTAAGNNAIIAGDWSKCDLFA